MIRGEVWWADLPGIGPRPTLILTRDTAIPLLSAVMVATITQTRRGIPTEVELDERDGVPLDSVVNLDNLSTVPKRKLRDRITRLSGERMAEVCEALRYAMSC